MLCFLISLVKRSGRGWCYIAGNGQIWPMSRFTRRKISGVFQSTKRQWDVSRFLVTPSLFSSCSESFNAGYKSKHHSLVWMVRKLLRAEARYYSKIFRSYLHREAQELDESYQKCWQQRSKNVKIGSRMELYFWIHDRINKNLVWGLIWKFNLRPSSWD